jgi:hypothetical protein
MEAYELMMNPVPPMTCGVQKIPSTNPWLLEMAFAMLGIAVNLFPSINHRLFKNKEKGTD